MHQDTEKSARLIAVCKRSLRENLLEKACEMFLLEKPNIDLSSPNENNKIQKKNTVQGRLNWLIIFLYLLIVSKHVSFVTCVLCVELSLVCLLFVYIRLAVAML